MFLNRRLTVTPQQALVEWLGAAGGGRRGKRIDSLEANVGQPASAPARWCIGQAVFEEASGRLLVGHQSHLLDHGSAGVLQRLARARGAVVVKDDLLAAGWPGRIVSENSLNKAVSRIRHLLGDVDGELLCTSHGYGYRLAATQASAPDLPAVDRSASPMHAAGVEVAVTSPMSPRRRAPVAWAGAALVAFVALVLALPATGPKRGESATRVLAASYAPAPSIDDAAPDGVVLPSIAVLPFADLSQAHDQGYFSDGLAEEILDRLAKIPQLRVASRTSAFALRGTREDVAQIGRRLGVSVVLEGSVRKSGHRIRITVQLIQVSDGFHLWSETYDQALTEVFAVQDDISRSVVDALQLHLPATQVAAMTRHRTTSPEAFSEYLRAHELRRSGNTDGDRRAISAYERAIALDPDYSSALAELGGLLGGDALWADTPREVTEGKARSLELMSRAIALEPRNTDYLDTRADLLSSTMHDWAGAQRDLQAASKLLGGPNARLMIQQSRILAMLGRIDEAIGLDRRIVSLNPSAVTPLGMLGFHLAVSGHYDEARAILQRAVRLRPDDDHNTYYLGLNELLDGKPEAAITAFEQSGHGLRLAGLAAAHHAARNTRRSQEALDALVARYADADAYQVAQAHAGRGEIDQAFAWLDRAEAQRDAGLVHLKFDPLMRPLHGDPRYLAWLRKLNLREPAGPASATASSTVAARAP